MPAGDGLALQLVPSFAVRGVPRELPRPGRRLVAFLAVQRAPVAREYAAFSLWPDAPEELAEQSLRTALWSVRRGHANLVEAARGSVGLGTAVRVDLADLVAASRTFARQQTSELVPMIEAYASELLPDWYEDWLRATQERWEQVRLHALEAIAAELTDRGALGPAIEAATAAISIEPLRETARRALIRAYLAEGNRCQALAERRRFARLLRRDIGVGPSPLIEDLFAAPTSARGSE